MSEFPITKARCYTFTKLKSRGTIFNTYEWVQYGGMRMYIVLPLITWSQNCEVLFSVCVCVCVCVCVVLFLLHTGQEEGRFLTRYFYEMFGDVALICS